MATPPKRIEELLALTSGNDISLATRRLMDICADHKELSDLRAGIIELRADYNLSRDLSAAELIDEIGIALRERAKKFADTIHARVDTMVQHPNEGVKSPVFTCNGLTKSYNAGGHKFTLGPIDLTLRTGEITGLVGENGNGKTTLLRQVAGLLDHTTGTLSFPGLPEDPYLLKQTIAWIPQRSTRWYGTLLQNLHFTAAAHGILGQANAEQVDFTLHRLGLTRYKNLTWKQLSSGYKLRFELAKMLVWKPRILVLDEPIANLDLQAQQLFLQDLKHIVGSPRDPISVILSSQQLHEIEAVADNIIFLKNGKPMFNGAVTHFDADRATNIFEVRGNFDRTALEPAVQQGIIIHIDDTGLVLRITTPRTVSPKEFIKLLANADLELSYFRDISTSTRKLFHQDS